MTKKIGLITLVLLLLTTSLFATDLDSLIANTLEKSNAVTSAKTTLESNKLAVEKILAEDNLSYSVSTGDVTYGDTDSSTTSNYSVNPNFTIYLNDDKSTTIDTDLSLDVTDGVVDTTLSSSISATFDFNEEDASTEMEAQRNLVEAMYQYNMALLNVKGQIYKYINQELSYEKTLAEAQNQLIIDQEDYDQNIELGNYISTDLEAVKQLATINYDKNKINQTTTYLEVIKEQFKNYTGFTYPDLDKLEEIDLKIDVNKTNTPIDIAKQQVAIDEEKYRIIKEDTNSIKTSGGLSSNIEDTLTLDGSAKYTKGNWSFTGEVEGSYDFAENSFTPYVTISGTYTSDSNTDEKEILIMSSANEVEQSKLDYQNELSDHSLECLSLQYDVQSSNLELEQSKLDNEVDSQNLENQQLLFDNGLITKTKLTAAQNTFDLNQIEAEILKISRFIIQNDIYKEFL